VAFFAEVVLEQSVVAIDFTPLGIVSGVRTYTLDDAQDVVPVEGKTPTLGRELGLLQQLLGNVGRFTPRGP
jgi:outer membrane protein assembly factor BamE (lipoprotein component of BamABCDE complex)